MTDVFLNATETKQLARGDSVKVRIDGEYKWISGTRVVNEL